MSKIQRKTGGNKAETQSMQPHGPFSTFEDLEHWSQTSDPITEQGKAIVFADYDAHKYTGETHASTELAAIVFSTCYKHITEEKNFESIISDLGGLFNLVKHNPHFRPEIKALRAIVEGEQVMNEFHQKIENL